MKIIDRNVPAEYYIECELDNIVEGDNIRLKKDLYHSNTPRLLEALSFTYRTNAVFEYVYSDQFRWEEREVDVDDITLGGMGEYLTDIIYGDEVKQNPRKFVEYINTHRDNAHFDQLKANSVPENRQIILLREHEGQLKMLDGSHRFLSMIMNGMSRVTAYVAVLVDKDAKPMIGDAIFLRLRRLWQQTNDPEFRKSIERTIAGMINASGDGRRAVKSYWVTMAPNEEVRAIGQKLVEG